MFCAQVLSVSACILGMYIIVNFILTEPMAPPEQVQYHLGCYLHEHRLEHANNISQRVGQLEAMRVRLWGGAMVGGQEGRVQQDGAVEIAGVFEGFVEEYRMRKEARKEYVELSKAVARAYQEYQMCLNHTEVDIGMQGHCQGSWGVYKGCEERLDELKGELRGLLAQKTDLEEQINGLLVLDGLEHKGEDQIRGQFEKQYGNKQRQVEKQQKNLQAGIKTLRQKISTVSYNLKVAQNQSAHSNYLYKQCIEHRKQFRLCEQLSKQVRNLGLGDLDTLADKVNKKRVSIARVQGLLRSESLQAKGDKYSTEKLVNKSLQEYKKLHKIYIETKAKMNKNCGCSEAEEQKLYDLLQKHKSQEKSVQSELQFYQEKLQEDMRSLQTIKNHKSQLLAQFQQNLTHGTQTQPHMIPESRIHQLEQKRSQLKQKTAQLEHQFYQLDHQCNQARDALDSYIPQIQQLSSCINLRHYYRQLRASLQARQQKLTLDSDAKRKVIQQLLSFRV